MGDQCLKIRQEKKTSHWCNCERANIAELTLRSSTKPMLKPSSFWEQESVSLQLAELQRRRDAHRAVGFEKNDLLAAYRAGFAIREP
jgi:hypothetical protein